MSENRTCPFCAEDIAAETITCPHCDSIVGQSPSPAGDGIPVVGQCPACKAVNSGDNRFCNGCGANLIESCPACKAENRVGIKFCGKCGAELVKLRQVAECRHQVADLMARAQTSAHRGEIIPILIQARLALKKLLAVEPADAEGGHQLEAVEAQLRTLFIEQARGQREYQAMETYRELLNLLPRDTEAVAALVRLKQENEATRGKVEQLITAGRFREAIKEATDGFAKFHDDALTELRNQAERKQRRLIELSEKLIPEQLQEKLYMAAQSNLNKLLALRADVAGVFDIQKQIQGAVKEADSCTERGDQLLAARKPVEALAAYQQALTACADYPSAMNGVNRAILAVNKTHKRRQIALVTGVLAIVIGLGFAGLHIRDVQLDEHGWRTATAAATVVGTNLNVAIQQYRQYLAEFPQGRHAATAKELAEVTLPRQMDEQAWKLACNGAEAAGTNYQAAIEQYLHYLDRFPQGSHAAAAKELERQTLPRQIDDQAWNAVTTRAEATGNDYEAGIVQYRQYLTRFPQGLHVSNATELVEVTLPKNIDDQAWKLACAGAEAAGTNYEAAIVQYRQYLSRFPQGLHAVAAKELTEATLDGSVFISTSDSEVVKLGAVEVRIIAEKDFAAYLKEMAPRIDSLRSETESRYRSLLENKASALQASAEAETAYKQAQAPYKQAQAAYEQAKTVYEQAKTAKGQVDNTFKHLRDARQAYKQAQAAINQAETAYNQAETAYEQAPPPAFQYVDKVNRTLMDLRLARQASAQSQAALNLAQAAYEQEAQAALNQVQAPYNQSQAALYQVQATYWKARATNNAAYERANTASEQLVNFETGRSNWVYAVADLYLRKLPPPAASTVTDAEGKFSTNIPRYGRFVVAATAQKLVETSNEQFYWLVCVSLSGQKSKNIELSNQNQINGSNPDCIAMPSPPTFKAQP